MTAILDKATHRYVDVDGKSLLGVSEVLQMAGIVRLDHIPKHNLDTAAERGEDVHMACADLDRGKIDWWSDDPLVAPHVEAYAKWKADVDFQPALIEEVLSLSLHGLAGTVDRTGSIRGQKGTRIDVIVDLKSGITFYPWVKLQLAGYAILLPPPTQWRRIGLRLKADATYDLKTYDDNYRDITAFMAALHVSRWKQDHGITG